MIKDSSQSPPAQQPPKEVRNFTRTEASSYLDVNARAIDKYCQRLNIYPRRHEDSQWSVDLNEIYKRTT